MTSHHSIRQSSIQRAQRTYPLAQIEAGEVVLLALASLRFATASQLQRIIFNSTAKSERMARHRATRTPRRLFDSGYLERIPVFAPSASTGRLTRLLVHALSASGARAIGVDPRWVRQRRPKPDQVLAHEFWLMEMATLAMEGCPSPLSISTWWDDRVLSARKRQGEFTLPNIPDGLLVVRNETSGKDFPSFIELDLGTESVSARTRGRRDFARKIEGYLEYLDGGFAQEFGIAAVPIILVITESERRLASLLETTARLGGKGRFWFTTLPRLRGMGNDELEADSESPQGPFWAQSWRTSLNDGWRSLAARCGL